MQEKYCDTGDAVDAVDAARSTDAEDAVDARDTTDNEDAEDAVGARDTADTGEAVDTGDLLRILAVHMIQRMLEILLTALQM
jgi:hypothetical protein